MSRKDYRKIAEVLRENKASEALIEAMADMLKADNGDFQRSLFVDAAKSA